MWQDLQFGYSVSCRAVPDYLGNRRTPDSDLDREMIFQPVAFALDSAIGSTNTAISLLEDACNRESLFITQQDIRDALDSLNSARRNYNIASSLLESLRIRDPNVSQ